MNSNSKYIKNMAVKLLLKNGMDSETALYSLGQRQAVYDQLSLHVSHTEVLITSLFVGHKCRVSRARKGRGNAPETD